MVSDMVLLKELPGVIKRSVAEYIGCLSGAIMEGAYIATIEAAGFEDVRVVEETSFPLGYMANDPSAHAIRDDVNLTPDEMRDLADSVVSLKVTGKKP